VRGANRRAENASMRGEARDGSRTRGKRMAVTGEVMFGDVHQGRKTIKLAELRKLEGREGALNSKKKKKIAVL